jgi:hypothetical protein
MSCQTRLDLLRLVYRHDHSAEALIERAKALEAYVSGQSQDPDGGVEERKPKRGRPFKAL